MARSGSLRKRPAPFDQQTFVNKQYISPAERAVRVRMLSERQQLKRAMEESKQAPLARDAEADSAAVFGDAPAPAAAVPLPSRVVRKLMSKKAARPPSPPPKVKSKSKAKSKKGKGKSKRRRVNNDSENEYGSSSEDDDEDDDDDEADEDHDEDDEEEEDEGSSGRRKRAVPKRAAAAAAAKKTKRKLQSSSEGDDDDDDEEEEPTPRARGRARAAPAQQQPKASAAAAAAKSGKRGGAQMKQERAKALFGESDSDDDLANNQTAPPPTSSSNILPELDDMEDPGYGSDLVIDEEDNRALNAMPEIQREQVLSDRYEKRQRWKELRMLHNRDLSASASMPSGGKLASAAKQRQLQQQRQQWGGKGSRKILVDSDSDEAAAEWTQPGSQRSTHESSAKASSSEEDDNVSNDDNDDDSAAMDDLSEDDDDGIDEEEGKLPVSFDDFSKLCLSRSRLLQHVDHPLFESGIVGLFIRVANGGANSGRSYEIMCVEKVIPDVQPYKVVGTAVKKPTRIFCKLKARGGPSGKSQDVRFDRVSDKPVTAEEFARVMQEPQAKGLNKRKGAQLWKRFRTHLVEHVFTQEEVQQMVAKHNLRKNRRLGNPSARRALLEEEIAEAWREKKALEDSLSRMPEDSFAGVLEDVARVSKRLSGLERDLADATRAVERYSARLAGSTASITERVNERNIVKSNQAHAEAQEKRLSDKRSAKVAETTNPFMRRPTRPIMLWATGSQVPQPGAEAPPVAEPIARTAMAAKPPAPSSNHQSVVRSKPVATSLAPSAKPAGAFTALPPALAPQVAKPIAHSHSGGKVMTFAEYRQVREQARSTL